VEGCYQDRSTSDRGINHQSFLQSVIQSVIQSVHRTVALGPAPLVRPVAASKAFDFLPHRLFTSLLLWRVNLFSWSFRDTSILYPGNDCCYGFVQLRRTPLVNLWFPKLGLLPLVHCPRIWPLATSEQILEFGPVHCFV
jgi:hypothetical protein